MKKISKLLKSKRKVYVYIKNESLWTLFINELKKEGFKDLEKKYDSLICLNSDKTISYVGIIGNIHYKTKMKDLIRINFSKLT